MCLAIPGKIVKIDRMEVTVEYPGETRKAFLGGDVEVKEGDYVMVQMGVVVKKITEEEAKLALKVWR